MNSLDIKMVSTSNEAKKITHKELNNYLKEFIEQHAEIGNKIWRSFQCTNVNEINQAFYKALDNLSVRDQLSIIKRYKETMNQLVQEFINVKIDIDSGSLIRRTDIIDFEFQLRNMLYLLHEYEKNFGFPFIMKPINVKFEDFYSALRYRCNNTVDHEIKIALGEIKKYVSEKLQFIIYLAKDISSDLFKK